MTVYKNSRVIVTGVNGQVGEAIMASSGGCFLELIPVTRSDWDMAKAPAKAAELVKQYQPEIVINTAAYTNVEGAEDDEETAYMVNAAAVAELATACKQAKIPLLHLSTDFVFDGTKDSPYTEEDPINPINVYGKSKAEGERLLRDILDTHLILRTSWVFSTTGKNFFTMMRRLGMERSEIKVVHDQRGCPTAASSIAKVLLRIAGSHLAGAEVPWGTYHYAGSPAVSWYEFAEVVFQKNEMLTAKLVPCASADYKSNVARPKNSVLCGAKAMQKLAAEPCEWKESLDDIC